MQNAKCKNGPETSMRLHSAFCLTSSEIKLRTHFEQSRFENFQRLQPGTVGVVLQENWAAIQRVRDVQIRRGSCPAKRERSREAPVELVCPVIEHRARLDEAHGRVRRVTRERPAERR